MIVFYGPAAHFCIIIWPQNNQTIKPSAMQANYSIGGIVVFSNHPTHTHPPQFPPKDEHTTYLFNLLETFDHKTVLSECSVKVFGRQTEAHNEGYFLFEGHSLGIQQSPVVYKWQLRQS